MKTRKEMRYKRTRRIRAKIVGSSGRPRLSVFRSHTGFTVQVIDDEKGATLVAVRAKGKNKLAARSLGTEIAKRCKEKKITKVIFDRGGWRYHGAIQELADAARAGGLQF